MHSRNIIAYSRREQFTLEEKMLFEKTFPIAALSQALCKKLDFLFLNTVAKQQLISLS